MFKIYPVLLKGFHNRKCQRLTISTIKDIMRVNGGGETTLKRIHFSKYFEKGEINLKKIYPPD